MTDHKLVHQDEIDDLLKASPGGDQNRPKNEHHERAEQDRENGEFSSADLTVMEKDALREIGNISMSTAANIFSQLLNRRVSIAGSDVAVLTQEQLFKELSNPFLWVKVKYMEGFAGYYVLAVKVPDAKVMVNLSLGDDGLDSSDVISEMQISDFADLISQVLEHINVSLAGTLGISIATAPPEIIPVFETDTHEKDINDDALPFADPVVAVSFRMNIENLLDTTVMQVIDLELAREQCGLLLKKYSDLAGEGTAPGKLEETTREGLPDFSEQLTDTGQSERERLESAYHGGWNTAHPIDTEKLHMLMDIPLKVSVILGRAKKRINDVLQMTPGAIVELEALVDEPVEILVNGKLVAKGEVVVVNENFGVKITSILSPRERINSLHKVNE